MAAADSIGKGLYSAPQGLESLGDSIEVTMDEESTVNIMPDGSAEILMGEATDKEDETDFEVNLAEHIDEGALHKLSSDLIELFEADMMSRKDWADTFVKGLEVLLKHMRRELEAAKADARDVVELRKEAGMLAAALRRQGILRP